MEKYTLIKCGKLYDGHKDEFQPNMQILVKGKYIEAVGKNIEIEDKVEIIDLSHLTVTPGLIDAHVHADLMDWKRFNEDAILSSDKWKALATVRTAEKTLRRGFTTIRCPGTLGISYYFNDVRRAIDLGYFVGSRMVIAATCAAPGSHGDPGQFLSHNPEISCIVPNRFIGSGPDFFSNAVREQKKHGYDFIKIFATGGFATPNDSPEEKQLTDAELEAIMETAHNFGMTVTAHAYTAELIKNLVNHGIDGIEHGSMIDEEAARLMEEKGVYLVPTFSPFEEIIHIDEENLNKKPKHFADKLRYYSKKMQDGRKTIINSKIKMGYGTDFVTVHNQYDCGYEYASWLNSGLGCFAALKAATSVNAQILQMPDIGSIQPGKYADIAAWSRDLVNDPNALLDCAFVMKDGVVYNTEKTIE